MKAAVSLALIASLASVSAQAVTAIISAPGAAPSGAATSENGAFGIQVVKGAAAAAKRKRQATQIGDGQVQAGQPVTQINDGQVQAATTTAVPVTQIGDGQVQNPAGNVATPVTQIGDGQVQAPSGGAVTVTVTKNNCLATPVTQISDGQIQAPMATPITQIGDGQVQAPGAATPVTQIGDGQVQAATGVPVTQIGDGQVQAATGVPVTQIGDGQVQAATGVPVTQIGDGQVQAATATPVTQIGDGQVQNPPTATPATAIGDGQVQAGTTLATVARSSATSAASGQYAVFAGVPQTCASTTGLLTLTLANGILKDSQGRTGYIASNSQFQFDGPPQAGAIYTAGWSVTPSGYLALGSQQTFYQCLSGSFYNLYYDNVLSAGQCTPVQFEVIQINAC